MATPELRGIILINNASGATIGDYKRWDLQSRDGLLEVSGNLGGTTITLFAKGLGGDDVSVKDESGADVAVTAKGVYGVSHLNRGTEYRAIASGGAPSGLYVAVRGS